MSLTVVLDVPPEVEERLRAGGTKIDHQFNEACALELYREEKLSFHELSRMLGLSHFATSELLQRRRIYVGALTMQDLEDDHRRLEELFNKDRG